MIMIFNLAPIICVLMTFLSLANVAAAIASDNRKYAKIFTAFVVIFMVLSISSMRVEESPLCMWEVEIKSFNHKTKISIELPEDAVYIHWGDCVYFVSFGKNVFGFNCLFPKVIDRMYYTEVHAMQKEERAIREHEKECLGSDDKGFYIKRIGKHDFIVNYQHEANNQEVHGARTGHAGKGLRAHEAAHDHAVRHAVQLLKQVAHQQRQAEHGYFTGRRARE